MNGKAIVSFIGFLVAIVVLFILALNFLRSPNTSSASVRESDRVSQHVNDTSRATLVYRGKIQNEEDHRAYRVTVTETSRTLEILSGYEQTVTERYTWPNNPEAYEQFMYALEEQGLSGVVEDEKADTRGKCAYGKLTEYKVVDGSDTVAYQWLTTCGEGSTKMSRLRNLYKAQIPEFNKKTSGLGL